MINGIYRTFDNIARFELKWTPFYQELSGFGDHLQIIQNLIHIRRHWKIFGHCFISFEEDFIAIEDLCIGSWIWFMNNRVD
jgi:hypothetical protein